MDTTTSPLSAQPADQPAQRVGPAGTRTVALPSRRVEALVLTATAVVVAGLGAPLGLLWSALSARVDMVMTASGGLYDPETEVFAGADGRFVLLTTATGLLTAVVSWLVLRRYRGPLMLLAVTLGGAGSALLASWIGSRIGLDDYRYLLAHAVPGWTFPIPLRLGMRGALASQALVTVLMYTVLAGCSRFPGLHRARLPIGAHRTVVAPAGTPAAEWQPAVPPATPEPAGPPVPGADEPPSTGAVPPTAAAGPGG